MFSQPIQKQHHFSKPEPTRINLVRNLGNKLKSNQRRVYEVRVLSNQEQKPTGTSIGLVISENRSLSIQIIRNIVTLNMNI